MLITSLKKQSFKDYETIIVNAKEHNFKNASETLNYGASLAEGDILVFCHQDIDLVDFDFLNKLKVYCDRYDFGIAGVAGIAADNKVYSNICHGKNKNDIVGILSQKVMDLVSVDECLFIIKKDKFNNFDYTNKTWHLYAVDYSYSCLKNNEKVLLFPLRLYHLSPGYSLND